MQTYKVYEYANNLKYLCVRKSLKFEDSLKPYRLNKKRERLSPFPIINSFPIIIGLLIIL